jgi:hypothetical protein
VHAEPTKAAEPGEDLVLVRDATGRDWQRSGFREEIGALVRPGCPARKPEALPASQGPARWEVVLRLHARHANAGLVVW